MSLPQHCGSDIIKEAYVYPMLTSTGIIRPAWRAMTSGRRIPAHWYSTAAVNMRYSKIKAVLLTRVPSGIQTTQHAVEQVNMMFTAMDKCQALDHDEDTLVAVILPEFGLNMGSHVTINMDPQNPNDWSAHCPVSVDIYRAFCEAVRAQMIGRPSGILFASGGTAVDSGRPAAEDETKRAGWNVGFVMESGPDAAAIAYAKVNTERNDGWDYNVFEPGVPDPETGTLLRQFGGLTTFTLTCYDLTRSALPSSLEQIDAIFAGSKGAPDWQERLLANGLQKGSFVFVNELTSAPSSGPIAATGQTGVFKADAVPNYPWFKRFHELADVAGLGDAVVGAYSWLFDATKEDLLGTHLGFARQPLAETQHNFGYGQDFYVRVSAPMPLRNASGSWVEEVPDNE